MTLSIRQEKVLLFIQSEIVRTGHAPTLEAIASHCGISSKGRIHSVITELVALGYVRREVGRTRGLSVLRPIAADRFEEAARAACSALQCAPSPDNIARAGAAIRSALIEGAV